MVADQNLNSTFIQVKKQLDKFFQTHPTHNYPEVMSNPEFRKEVLTYVLERVYKYKLNKYKNSSLERFPTRNDYKIEDSDLEKLIYQGVYQVLAKNQKNSVYFAQFSSQKLNLCRR